MQSGGSGGESFGNFCVESSPEYPPKITTLPPGFPDPPPGNKRPLPEGATSVPL